MNLVIENHSFQYEIEKLLRVFFPNTKIAVTKQRNEEPDYVLTALREESGKTVLFVCGAVFGEYAEKQTEANEENRCFDESEEAFLERELAVALFDFLREITGYTPPWGILTGVRPAKLMRMLISQYGAEAACAYFRDHLHVSADKTALALQVAEAEAPIIAQSAANSFSLYISIPFCPSRCSYCSFVSHSNNSPSARKLIPRYVKLLCEELRHIGSLAAKLDLRLESVYMGGGTPTALSAEDLRRILGTVKESFDLSHLREYTVEAGRPDSVTIDKLNAIKQGGGTRISINPQTFNDNVLREIGRKHSAAQTLDAMAMARKAGFSDINMDLIAGLPTDTPESFQKTLDATLALDPENITVHTLALKRAATLVTDRLEIGSAEAAQQMLAMAQSALTEAGYAPYYMYRQSNCLGNLENVGWCKPGYEGLYNVYMMEECHTVLAAGAGAVSKLCWPDSNRLERIFNYKYPYEYIDRFEEVLRRKERVLSFYDEVFSASEGCL